MTRSAIFVVVLAAVAAGAFAGASSAVNNGSSPRSGELHVTKECSQYFGKPGEFCTITSSNLPAIARGMNVVYASALTWPTLDSDLVLDGPGINDAFGHVTLNALTRSGVVTFSGGNGRFSGFQASVVVSYDADDDLWLWDGEYSFDRTDD